MSLNLYDISIPPFLRFLQNLSNILKKGEEWANENSKDHSQLLHARLFPDMQDLVFQVQRVSDTAKNCIMRVGGAEAVPLPDEEKTFADLYTRIEKTISILQGVDRKTFDGTEDKEIVIKPLGSEFKFSGKSYVLDYAVPNFYFHVTTAYALLRKMGVPLGKFDYMGAEADKK